jgi:predicted RND superfamily exporter protein
VLKQIYQKTVLNYPRSILTLLLVGIFSFGYYAWHLEIDASSETLLLDDDPSLKFSETISKRFETSSTLVMTYSPQTELLSTESLEQLKALSRELEALSLVTSVDSILTVPLLLSPPQKVSELINTVQTLSNAHPPKDLVKNEFLTSPLYKGNLVSEDFKTTALILNLAPDSKYATLKHKKRVLERMENPTKEEEEALKQVRGAFKVHRDKQRAVEQQNIADIRQIMHRYQGKATLFLGGADMIANDIVGYVKSDLLIYGSTLIVILLLVLWFVFRALKWILIPLLIATLSILATTSVLGFFSWEITVISSNFIALQLIITLSIVLHLIVQYNEMLRKYPHVSHKRVVLVTMLHKAKPTFFAIITTIAGFSSLVVSNIKPVINLGWMMSAGVVLSLIIAFIVFPTALLLFPKRDANRAKKVKYRREGNTSYSFIDFSLNRVLRDKRAIFIVTALVVLFSVMGASKLIVENAFINYFKQESEIYKGMKVIDENLGGTTPLDIVLTFSKEQKEVVDEDDEFGDEFSETAESEQYWFTKEKMDTITRVHNYLETIPEIGNVQSLASMLKIGKQLNENKALDGFSLGLLYTHLPDQYKQLILSPYVSIEHNQVRFATRIIDSKEGLRRGELLTKIQTDLNVMVHPEVGKCELSNLMVLYNNMLQSLFDSQITTLGSVLLIIFFMFLLLFFSLRLALIAIVVNIIPIGLLFGFMGWFEIPLDIMTITIAAIAIGIGVDDTIHYIHRFRKESAHSPNYHLAVKNTTTSVGYAMQYTSVTVMLGFSILILSNLVPTIYFGILTMLVMAVALLANMILLPKILIGVRVFKRF